MQYSLTTDAGLPTSENHTFNDVDSRNVQRIGPLQIGYIDKDTKPKTYGMSFYYNSTNSNYQLNFDNLNNINTYLGCFNEVICKYQLKRFDFVLCNILAEVIKEMIPNIYKCLKENGEVIFSGILNSQKDEIVEIMIQNNLKLLDVSIRNDWACISAKKDGNLV